MEKCKRNLTGGWVTRAFTPQSMSLLLQQPAVVSANPSACVPLQLPISLIDSAVQQQEPSRRLPSSLYYHCWLSEIRCSSPAIQVRFQKDKGVAQVEVWEVQDCSKFRATTRWESSENFNLHHGDEAEDSLTSQGMMKEEASMYNTVKEKLVGHFIMRRNVISEWAKLNQR